MEVSSSHFLSWESVLMATPASSTSEAETSLQQVMGPHHKLIHAIRLYTGEKLNRKNWSAFEFRFTTHFIRYDLVAIFLSEEGEKIFQNKVYSILAAALESSQFVLVNKTLTSAQAWVALKSFYRKKGGQSILLLMQKFRHAKMLDGKDLY